MNIFNKVKVVETDTKNYKTKSCIFDDSDGLWCADIDTKIGDKWPKIGDDVLIDGDKREVKGVQGYHHNFSIKFSSEIGGYR